MLAEMIKDEKFCELLSLIEMNNEIMEKSIPYNLVLVYKEVLPNIIELKGKLYSSNLSIDMKDFLRNSMVKGLKRVIKLLDEDIYSDDVTRFESVIRELEK